MASGSVNGMNIRTMGGLSSGNAIGDNKFVFAPGYYQFIACVGQYMWNALYATNGTLYSESVPARYSMTADNDGNITINDLQSASTFRVRILVLV